MRTENDAVAEGLVSWTIFGLVILLIVGFLSGCIANTGWGAGVMFYPVSQVRNVQSLQGTQSDTRIVKRQPALKTGATAEEDY